MATPGKPSVSAALWERLTASWRDRVLSVGVAIVAGASLVFHWLLWPLLEAAYISWAHEELDKQGNLRRMLIQLAGWLLGLAHDNPGLTILLFGVAVPACYIAIQAKRIRTGVLPGEEPRARLSPVKPARPARLLCVRDDELPFRKGDIASFDEEQAASRLESGRWIEKPPSWAAAQVRCLGSLIGLAPAPPPILVITASDGPVSAGIVSVTNHGGTAEVAAIACCMTGASFRQSPGKNVEYAVAWRENGRRSIILKRGVTATLYVIRTELSENRPDDYDFDNPSLKGWLVVTVLGDDGHDSDRRFFAHPQDWNGGVLSFALLMKFPTSPPLSPIPSAHFVCESPDRRSIQMHHKGPAWALTGTT